MRTMLRFLAFTVAAAVVACGSDVQNPTGSGGSGGSGSSTGGTGPGTGGASTTSSTGDAGAPCGLPPDPGICAESTQCVSDAENCVCGVSGFFSCTDPNTGNPVADKPPNGQPKTGDCCDIEGLLCGGYTKCGPICACKGGLWSCQNQDPSCASFTCPADPSALEDSPCDGLVGTVCAEGPSCGLRCTCGLADATGATLWTCTSEPNPC